ncbi:Mannosyl-oligosaccharide 1,2-alpha-mannosidase IC [Psilocybe cubensis]|uniref:alpha-1,2-Mannosidase n=2 Tax=Psilocybe cubensis TaxID=181762 RepID=A0A8H8CIR2_PSICU|nr:Mannosyl-oligosaccharide 1,2-alpha-mannosidase IC [Psilocybe cubensis]KAH9475725.1 Mannosyl-oligosaccharide 1,2-alpha-mannosidase IC [Psilocybe cubensis]
MEQLARLSTRANPLSKLVTRWVLVAFLGLALLWYSKPWLELSAHGDFTPPLWLYGPHSENDETPYKFAPPPPHELQAIWEPRKEEVRAAFRHAWSGYMMRAFPSDELLPLSGGKSDKYNGWSVTLFDSLDTMWIMGLHEEFKDAVERIKDVHFFPTKPDHYAPFFETTIRYLGGILSAYALSGEETLLRLADEMGQILIPAFNGTESGLPAFSVNVENGKILSDLNKKTVLFAEAASCQLEFKYLAKLTGNREYYQRVQDTMNVFYKANVSDGLFHDNWLMKEGTPTGTHFTIGATADSGYEYLLKQWLQSGDVQARDQYIKSAEGIINNLIYVTPKRGLMYVGDLQNNYLMHRLEHLSCYLPGVLALGAATLDLEPEVRELHEMAAHGLAYTCAISYADQVTGLGPDQMQMTQGKKWIDEVYMWNQTGRMGEAPGMREYPVERDPRRRDYVHGWPSAYLLRPETIESIYYMWKTTGDIRWRERGYEIFKAINKHTWTKFGFTSVYGVDSVPVTYTDDMPSWFLAETLKYLYLLMDDTDVINLREWVFNTEAHPLPMFSWTEEEKRTFKISS